MVAVRADLADRLNQIASQKGTTIYALANDTLNLAIALEEAGLTPRGVMEERLILEAARLSGFMPCPETLWYEMVDQAHRGGGDVIAKSWFEAGATFGKLYMIREGKDHFSAFKRDIRNLTWNASDLSFTEDNGEVQVRCIGRRFSESYAQLFGSYMEGAFGSFGYECVRKDVARGAFQLRFAKKDMAAPPQNRDFALAFERTKMGVASQQ